MYTITSKKQEAQIVGSYYYYWCSSHRHV